MNKLCACIFILLMACRSNPGKTKPLPSKTDTAAYYPVAVFFRDQLSYVDLRNFVIDYAHTANGKKDSSLLSKDGFLQWGNLFLQKALLFTHNKQLFRESVFQDLSTQSYTLNYTPIDQQVDGIQHVDVLLDEDTKIAKRVFMKVISTAGDTTLTEQYNWKANKGLQLTRFKTAANNYSSTEVIYINWQNKE